MNTLYATTAVIEAGAGLALLCSPSAATNLLFGTPLEPPAALTVARVGGTGCLLLELSIAQRPANHHQQQSRNEL